MQHQLSANDVALRKSFFGLVPSLIHYFLWRHTRTSISDRHVTWMDASLAAAVNILLVAIATDGWTRQDLTTAWSVLPLTSSWPHLIGLEELILTELSLCYSIVYYYNGAQRYEQFLEVSRLYQALILLALALRLQSSWCNIYLIFCVTLFYLLGHVSPTAIKPRFSWYRLNVICSLNHRSN